MNPHVIESLAAYHDGELPSTRQHQIEQHLLDCPACRAELEIFVELSSLLKSDPVPLQTPPQRFTAQVQLRLPRAFASRPLRSEGQFPRWALGVPVVLIAVWAFLEAALRVTSFLFAADQVFGPSAALFNHWFASEGILGTGTSLLLFNALLLIGMSILWSAWMALWLAWKKNQTESFIKGGVI